ncbi:MAG: TonB-dependent receptor [Ignavibacteria bacterium]|nr:TonB-dependent receptor [Ignavibacteria bacterium]
MKKLLIFFLAVLFTVSINTIIQAQDKEEYEEEDKDSLEFNVNTVMITGTRTNKKIIDIPYAVERVDKSEFKFNRNVSIKDILADVPGLFLQNRYGNHDVRVSVRGYGTRSNAGVRGIRILQDGIPESEPDGSTTIDAIDYNSLGGVEIVKGNSSSLYTNAPGGVINFISDLSYPYNFLTSINQAGEFQLRQNGFKLGMLQKDYRFFLTYNYRNYGGYRPHSSEYVSIVNSIFDAYPDKKTRVEILGNFVRGIIKLPGSLTLAEYNADPYQARTLAVAQDFRRETQKGRLGIRYKRLFGKDDSQEFEVTGFGAIKDYVNTTAQLYTFINRYVLGSTIRYVNKSHIAKRENEFSTGIDYYYQTGPASDYDNINGVKGSSLISQNTETLNNLGIYFSNQYNIVKGKMDLLLTGRFDRIIYDVTPLQYLGYNDTTRIYQQFTPKIALNYKLTPSIAIYTSFGTGYDTPALTELANYPYSSNGGRTSLNPDLTAQKSLNFEIGIKGSLQNEKEELFKKTYFTATLYNSRVDDEIVPFSVSDRVYFRNAARTNRTGVEIGLKNEVVDGVELVTNYNYAFFKYTDYVARIYDVFGNITDERYDGNILPSFPRHIVNVILSYKYRVNKQITILAQADGDYIDKMFVNDKNSEEVGSYSYFNSLLGVTAEFDRFNFLFSLGVNNIFDRKYVGFININDFNERYYELGQPRNFYSGLNIEYKF